MKQLAHAQSRVRSFNYDKLQAFVCIASSAAVSIGAIYWLISRLY